MALRKFWELESLGILKEEHPVQHQFSQRIKFDQGRYEVHLPWKDSHIHLPDNYDLCRRRLNGLLKRLCQNPEQLLQYDSIFQDQLRQGVVETVGEPASCIGGRLHYLPHHGVVRHDKQTTMLQPRQTALRSMIVCTLAPTLGRVSWTSSSDFGFTRSHLLEM